jgi:hypothetical protein
MPSVTVRLKRRTWRMEAWDICLTLVRDWLRLQAGLRGLHDGCSGAFPNDTGRDEPYCGRVIDAGALTTRLRRLRERFDQAHHEGIDALEREDYSRLAAAIDRERQVIEEYGRLLNALIAEAQRPGVTAQQGLRSGSGEPPE